MKRAPPIKLKSMESQTRLVVGIATRGRCAILTETIAFLAKQARQPDNIFVAYADPEDVGDAPAQFPHVTFIQTPLGLTRQRNAILTLARESDILLFIDDDFYLDPQYLEITERFFVDHPEVVASTGRVLADDVKGPGLSVGPGKVNRGRQYRRPERAEDHSDLLRLRL